MNQKDVDRVLLVHYAVKEVSGRGSLEQLKAVCYCLRNRVRAGWGEWIDVIQSADEALCNKPAEHSPIDVSNRAYQRLLHEVDDIYFGKSQDHMTDGSTLEDSLCSRDLPAFYWVFLDRPLSEWFKSNIAKDNENHPNISTMGMMLFFG
jgi:hypothetical protein